MLHLSRVKIYNFLKCFPFLLIIIMFFISHHLIFPNKSNNLMASLYTEQDSTEEIDTQIITIEKHTKTFRQNFRHHVPKIRQNSEMNAPTLEQRLLIILAFFPGNGRDDNLEYFLRQGIIGSDTNGIHMNIYHHYVIVLNGDLPDSPLRKLLVYLNQTYSFFEVHTRSNHGFDVCAWKLTLSNNLPDFPLRHPVSYFTHVFTMNGSVRGPLLPNWITSFRLDNDKNSNNYVKKTVQTLKSQKSSSVPDSKLDSSTSISIETTPIFPVWTQIFLSLIKPSPLNVRLVGTAINCLLPHGGNDVSRLHIQSMLLLFQASDIPLIRDTFVCSDDKNSGIFDSEIPLTGKILKDGGNLAVTEAFWRNHDFRNTSRTLELCSQLCNDKMSDVYFPNRYGGIDIVPFEVIFFKTNRNVGPGTLMLHTNWQLQSQPWSFPCNVYAQFNYSVKDCIYALHK